MCAAATPSAGSPSPARHEPLLTIIIPAYNEEDCLEGVVRTTVAEAVQADLDYELLIVDDGSSDRTVEIARRLIAGDPGRRRLVRHHVNRGSGMAIRTGIAFARGALVIYVPADGQFEIAELRDYVAAARDAEIVIGGRVARSDYSWFRLLSSRVFIFLCNHLFRQEFTDVNWVHLWRRRIFETVQAKSAGVFFLEEILARARRQGCRVVEIPSQYKPRGGGKAKGSRPTVILRTIVDMIHLWVELHLPRGL